MVTEMQSSYAPFTAITLQRYSKLLQTPCPRIEDELSLLFSGQNCQHKIYEPTRSDEIKFKIVSDSNNVIIDAWKPRHCIFCGRIVWSTVSKAFWRPAKTPLVSSFCLYQLKILFSFFHLFVNLKEILSMIYSESGLKFVE